MNAEKFKYYLRVTAAPNCNLRCIYCNPEGEFEKKHMIDSELVDVIQASSELGINTVHYTGGEPLVRKNFVGLVEKTQMAGMTTIDVTTNGVLLDDIAADLKSAGLTGTSISLDSLNPEKVYEICGSNVYYKVRSAIEKSCQLFDNVVVNMVVLKENKDEIPDFINFARQMYGRFIPRFCELQNYGPAYGGKPENFIRDLVPRKEIIRILSSVDTLEPRNIGEDDTHNSHAEYFKLKGDGLIVGVIAPYTHGWPCAKANCGRIRIGPMGQVKSCIASATYQLNNLSHSKKVDVLKKVIDEKNNRREQCNFPLHHVPLYNAFRFGKAESSTEIL